MEDNALDLWLGDHIPTSGYNFNGLIDEVRIYNRALSADEIRYHYNRGDPVAHYEFEGNANDSTDNNNDGTVTGATYVTGKYGQALSFDGIDDYVTVPDDSTLDIDSAITLESWAKDPASSYRQKITIDHDKVDIVDWLDDWDKRIKVTADNTVIDSNLSHFPTTIKLGTSVGKTSADVSCVFDELTSDDNRKKIAVTKADGTTQLYVEIDQWDDASEEAVLHCGIDGDTLASGADTDYYLYYDSEHADNEIGRASCRERV